MTPQMPIRQDPETHDLSRPRFRYDSASRRGLLMVGQLPHQQPEGVSVAFEALVNEFSRRGQSLFVIDWNQRGGTERPGSTSWHRALTAAYGIARLFRFAPQCAWLYMTIGASALGFIRDACVICIARLFGLRVTVHLKGGGFRDFYESSNPLVQFCIRQALAQVNAIVVLGERLRDQFYFVPNVGNKLRVIYNGLPGDHEMPASVVSRKGMREGGPLRILYLSNLIPSKGFVDLIEACRILSDRGRDYRADFYGRFVVTPERAVPNAPVDAKGFEDLVKRLGIDANVRYHGVALGEHKWRVLAESDVLVLPTYFQWEGQPICIIEAFSVGLPVISTRHKSIPEQVTHEGNGLIVDARSPAQIAVALERLIADKGLYTALSRRARATYEEKFSFASHFSALSSVILDETELV